MSKTGKITALLMAMALLPASVLVSGSSLNDMRKKQENIEGQIQEAKDMLKSTQAEMSATAREIVVLDTELDVVTTEYNATNDELEATRVVLAQTEAELEDAQEQRELSYEMLQERMRFMYVNGRVSYLEVLFRANSFNDLLNSMEYINRIVKYDDNIVDEYMAAEEVLAGKLNEVEEQESEVNALAEELEVKKLALEDTVATKEKLMDELTQSEQQYLDEIETLEKADKEVEALIKNAEEAAARTKYSAAITYNGSMGWPVKGYSGITSHYGSRKHPVYGYVKMHTGVDLQAPYGTTIVASDGGVVTASQYMSGYGYAVIINHGGGISTLYGHNSSLLVSVGDTVSKGQTIAKSGSSGTATGPHCHFEVRVNGSTTSPKPYLGY